MDIRVHPTAVIGQNCILEPGVIIEAGVHLGDGSRVGAYTILYQDTHLGEGCKVQPYCILGLPVEGISESTHIGPGAVIRAGTVIYAGVTAGSFLMTGHHALIRERTVLGDRVLVGTHAVIDGEAVVGDDVSMQTGVYVTRHTVVGRRVFLGPYVKTTNDRYMKAGSESLKGPIIQANARIGCGALILPMVTVGHGAIIGAGAVVTSNVSPQVTVVGVPARPLVPKGVDLS